MASHAEDRRLIEKSAANASSRMVFFETPWTGRQEYSSFFRDPPEGYRFVAADGIGQHIARGALRCPSVYAMDWWLQGWLPMNWGKSLVNRFRRLPPEVGLTYSVAQLVLRPEPWVLDLKTGEALYSLLGRPRAFDRWKWIVRRSLLSPYCRKLIFELEVARRGFLRWTRWEDLEYKTVVIPLAVPRRDFARQYRDPKDPRVRLLFVGSANIKHERHFLDHGGLILLEAFPLLRERYPSLELVVRSNVPRHIRNSYHGIPGLKICEEVLPWEQLEAEFKEADIFVYPGHVTPSVRLLDAMSYELPVVCTDVYGNAEIVVEGRTGLLVHHQAARQYIIEGCIPRYDLPAFGRTVSSVDTKLISGFVEKVSVLLENPHLRQRLGREARTCVEDGKFSIKQRNELLKRALDDAVGGPRPER